MTNSHVVPGLIAKRAEMSGEIEALQMRVRQMLIDLDALDSAIRVFQPDIDLQEVRPQATAAEPAAFDAWRVARCVQSALSTSPCLDNETARLTYHRERNEPQ